MEHLTTRFQVKSADGASVRGYASIFGNEDLGGDIVMPGAFQEFERNSEGKVVMLFQHGQSESLPIGKASVQQDSKGLAFDAELIIEDPFVARVHTHLKAKTLERMSIGYDVLQPNGSEMKDGRRLLKRLKLYEISIVQWGMNPMARVEGVKSRADLEHVARDVLGLSKSKARKLAYAGWPIISGEDDVGPDDLEERKRQKVEAILIRQGFAPEDAGRLSVESLRWDDARVDEHYAAVEGLVTEFQSLNSLLRG